MAEDYAYGGEAWKFAMNTLRSRCAQTALLRASGTVPIPGIRHIAARPRRTMMPCLPVFSPRSGAGYDFAGTAAGGLLTAAPGRE